MPVTNPPAFKPAVAPVALGAAGTVLTSNGTSASTPPTFQVASGGGVGAALTFASPSGTIDPSITGFTAGVGSAGTGRIKVTLSANTTWEGLPAGADGQQLFVIIVAGAFTLTLSALNGATAQAQIKASNSLIITLQDTVSLLYDTGLGQWLLVS